MKQATHRGGNAPVPIIDITPFTTGETRGRADVAEAVRTACEEIGFFVIAGHGFPEGLVTRIYDVSRAFFDLPTEEKDRIGESGPVMGGLMHFGLGREALAATLGGETIPDLKETLDFGPGFYGDRWPMRPPGLEPAWRAYYEAMSMLAATLRSIFATALGLAPEYFEDRFRGHLSVTACDRLPRAIGAAGAGAAPGRSAFRLWRTDDIAHRRRARRAAGANACRSLERCTAHPRLVCRQHRRRDDALDQRPLDLDATPGREPAGGPRAACPAAVDRLLPQPAARHGDRMPAAVSRAGHPAEVSRRSPTASTPSVDTARRTATTSS